MKIILPTVSDNTSAESGVNQLFTTSEPLCFFLEKLGQLSSSLNVDMDTSHISGTDNSEADLLSRWNFQSPLPTKFTSEFRVRITLEDLWMIKYDKIISINSPFKFTFEMGPPILVLSWCYYGPPTFGEFIIASHNQHRFL